MGSNIYGVALQRAVEKHQLVEWHITTEGNLHVIVPGGGLLKIEEDQIHTFVLGMMVGEGW